MNTKRILALALSAVRELRDILLACVAILFLLVSLVLPQRALVSFNAFLARQVGMRIPRLRKLGMENLALAFPGKSEDERREILLQSWDNMGRIAIEYFYMDRIWDFDPDTQQPGRIETAGVENYLQLANSNKPAIILSAHLANWELPMLAAAHHGLAAAALYARPRNRWIARMVVSRRGSAMGTLIESGPGALQRVSRSLDAGIHLGLLVDQFHINGPMIRFFGHTTRANPVFARLARLHECPVHMVRVIRLPGDRFRVELGDALNLPRDESGRIDIARSLQMVADIVEGWVREHPGQWIWVHRRWR